MGVPALFRWLSKKYPKIIYPVRETEEQEEDSNNIVIPANMSEPNPNGMEFDNLYLDMNGIVHPCTHPEGKPAPETEEDMMVEIFNYTERVVNMIRPRKLLFMAIDGVAPRAKMNQQRSRRFRAAQDAKDKEDARIQALEEWKARGLSVSADEEIHKPAWDSNAITPGTPFMDLLAASLRYWVVKKMNSDPGWKNIQVIISDASVPGEGEHKIMDFIRRQRVYPTHDPNTKHVIYGLDADLIMLALATHEPHFRVLREDVFSNDISPTACRTCGQEGHYSAQCTGQKAEVIKKPSSKKPFIFLDVSILREYLEVELNVPNAPFRFDLEQAIDDWVLLIFFVGNDFLPHLPSLEIREGAIDTLLKIWKQELTRMGGYLTNHGQLELKRVQTILNGLAQREDDIFRKRREAEQRQEFNAKRRKLDAESRTGANTPTNGPSPALGLTASTNSLHTLPPKPTPDFAASADALGLGSSVAMTAAQAFSGSNHDIVANRRAIRNANMSAAEMLKAEIGLVSVKTGLPVESKPLAVKEEIPGLIQKEESGDQALMSVDSTVSVEVREEDSVPGFSSIIKAEVETKVETATSSPVAGVKRKREEQEQDGEATPLSGSDSDEEPSEAVGIPKLKVNPDGSVDTVDTIQLWEPGYRERYYQQKFGVEPSDVEFRKKVAKAYVEGMCWVLMYYYQGAPSWQWYYPYHFAPFAADFQDVGDMNISFEKGQPFKPYEQLMGVFPAASRKHIPPSFQPLMTDEDSPILDFYPTEFEIDMNGKKMAWQGVALLPFIDQKRLLDAMATKYPLLTEDEVERNKWGNDVIFASDEHPVYPFYESLYGKHRSDKPIEIDPKLSKGINGSVACNPKCLPGSTYHSPIESMPNITNDQTLSVLYYFPEQRTPHRSVLLPGVKRQPRQLDPVDLEITRNGGYSRGRGRGGRGYGEGFHSQRANYSDRGGFGADKGPRRDRPPYERPSRGHTPATYSSRPPSNYGPPGQQSYSRPPPSNYGPPQGRGGYGGYNDGYGGYGNGGGRQDYGAYGGNYGAYGNTNSQTTYSYGNGNSYGAGDYNSNGRGYHSGGYSHGGGGHHSSPPAYGAPRGRGRGGW